VRRGDQVHATDGNTGRVQGLVIDPGDHHVTHVLLQEGHLWGRKEVAIPITAVTEIDDAGIRLNLSTQGVEDLTPVNVEHPNGQPHKRGGVWAHGLDLVTAFGRKRWISTGVYLDEFALHASDGWTGATFLTRHLPFDAPELLPRGADQRR